MPITIDEVGLQRYLDATKDFHNGLGYDELTNLLSLKVPKTEIAKQFSVSVQTIHDWVKRLP